MLSTSMQGLSTTVQTLVAGVLQSKIRVALKSCSTEHLSKGRKTNQPGAFLSTGNPLSISAVPVNNLSKQFRIQGPKGAMGKEMLVKVLSDMWFIGDWSSPSGSSPSPFSDLCGFTMTEFYPLALPLCNYYKKETIIAR